MQNPFAKKKGPRSVDAILSQFTDNIKELEEREQAPKGRSISSG